MKSIICHLVFLLSATAHAVTDDYYNFKWLSTDKNIFALQQKFFSKKRSFYANFGLGKNNTSGFQDTTGLHISGGFFFTETWGIEGFYHAYSNSNNDTYEKVSSDGLTIPNVRRFKSTNGFSVVYSPFYGKLNTFNKILYMELIVGAGISKISAENNIAAFEGTDPTNSYEVESFGALHYKLQLRLNVTKHILFNMDYYTYYYSAKNRSAEEEVLQSATDIIFSAGFTL